MEFVIALMIGVGLGMIINFLTMRPKEAGVLLIETSDPDGPYMFLELNIPPQGVCDSDHVIFKVKVHE